jgi:transposase
VFGLFESASAFQSGGDLIQGRGWQERPTCMPKALSFDLRSRVLAAIDEGLSCRQAATRFGVSASSAIRWQAQRRAGGDARPKPQGGDRLSRRTEAHADLIHAALAEEPDITLPELKARLAEQEALVSVSALGRFCRRHKITRKKDGARGRAGPARPPQAARGLVRGPTGSRSRAADLHR